MTSRNGRQMAMFVGLTLSIKPTLFFGGNAFETFSQHEPHPQSQLNLLDHASLAFRLATELARARMLLAYRGS